MRSSMIGQENGTTESLETRLQTDAVRALSFGYSHSKAAYNTATASHSTAYITIDGEFFNTAEVCSEGVAG